MGRVDLFHSRRTNYHKCKYWIRDERDSVGPASQWILDNKVSGFFYAKPISNKNTNINVINGVWALDNNRVTLETDDHIEDLIRGSVVEYEDALWTVDSIQREIHGKESEFSKHNDYKYILSLRK